MEVSFSTAFTPFCGDTDKAWKQFTPVCIDVTYYVRNFAMKN